MEVFDIKPNTDVVVDYKVEKANPDNLLVMLTGRLFKLDKEVKAILDHYKLSFDEYRYNTGGTTDMSKKLAMEALLKKYPDVEEIQCWDDRLTHVPIFEEWGKEQCLKGRLKNFSITVVASNNH